MTTFAKIATTKFFPLHRAHMPVVISRDWNDDTAIPIASDLLTGGVALSAALLDASEFRVEHLRRNVVVIYCNIVLYKHIKTLLVAAAPSPPMWISSHQDEQTLVESIQYGELLIAVAESESSLPDGLASVADVVERAPKLDRLHIEAAIRMMTATDVNLPNLEYDLTKTLLALRPGRSAKALAARVVDAHRDVVAAAAIAPDAAQVAEFQAAMKAAVEKKKADEAQAKATASAVAKIVAVAENVTPLRELSGYGDLQTWGMQLAEDLKAFRDGGLSWDDVDKGALISGPPGCGKTFFARALAAECGVELVTTSYGEWSGQKDIGGDQIQKGLNKLFADLRKKAESGPIIVFVDEIDSIGKRGTSDRADYWYGPIINSWLAFLDGAEPRAGIVVIAATNHPDRVDDALRRPGRLERHFVIPRPSIDDLAGVIKQHAGNLADINRAARECRGMSAADVAQVAREARRSARRQRRDVVVADIVDLVRKRRSSRSAESDRIICVHEAGHALVALRLGLGVEHIDADRMLTVTNQEFISPRLADLEADISCHLAGRAAEISIFGVPSAGAISDLDKATTEVFIAMKSGLLGTITTIPDHIAIQIPSIRDRVDAVLSRCAARAQEIVEKDREVLESLARNLADQRYLDTREVDAIVNSVVAADEVDDYQMTP